MLKYLGDILANLLGRMELLTWNINRKSKFTIVPTRCSIVDNPDNTTLLDCGDVTYKWGLMGERQKDLKRATGVPNEQYLQTYILSVKTNVLTSD